MIKESEVFKIGKLSKPHGLKGEIAFNFDNDVFDRVECPYLIVKVDEIFVPFFLEGYRFKGSETALLRFTDITSDEKALRIQGREVYFPRKYYNEDIEDNLDYSWDFFIGFKASDKLAGELGTIQEVDTQTINTLFRIESDDNKEYIIPAVEEFILNIDPENKLIEFNLPEGLLE